MSVNEPPRPAATYARATLEYDNEHERELIEAITRTIFEASVVSDVNAIVHRTGETAEVLITILAGVLAMSPSVARSPTRRHRSTRATTRAARTRRHRVRRVAPSGHRTCARAAIRRASVAR